MPRDNLGTEDTYEVEAILKVRVKAKGREFLVKWKGCESNDWLPEADLDCPVLLAEFERNQADAKQHKTKKRRAEVLNPVKVAEDNEPRKRRRIDKGETKKTKAELALKNQNSYAFEICLVAEGKKLKEIQARNLAVVAKCQDELGKFDFWRVLDDYNLEVRIPPRPGHEYFVKELGPYVASKARLAENCQGCGNVIDTDEYCFWHAREAAFVELHFCQLCVAYVIYHLKVNEEKPQVPYDLRLASEQVLFAKYNKFYVKRFPDFNVEGLK